MTTFSEALSRFVEIIYDVVLVDFGLFDSDGLEMFD